MALPGISWARTHVRLRLSIADSLKSPPLSTSHRLSHRVKVYPFKHFAGSYHTFPKHGRKQWLNSLPSCVMHSCILQRDHKATSGHTSPGGSQGSPVCIYSHPLALRGDFSSFGSNRKQPLVLVQGTCFPIALMWQSTPSRDAHWRDAGSGENSLEPWTSSL